MGLRGSTSTSSNRSGCFGREVAQVAGAEEAVVVEGAVIECGVDVAVKQLWALGSDLPFLAHPEHALVVADDADLDTWGGAPFAGVEGRRLVERLGRADD